MYAGILEVRTTGLRYLASRLRIATLEFHISHIPPQDSESLTLQFPSVRWIVFRAAKDGINRRNAERMDDLLSQLVYLQRVVFEYDSTLLETPNLSSLLRSVQNRLHVWSTRDAKEYAHRAQTSGVPSGDQLPISSDDLLEWR